MGDGAFGLGEAGAGTGAAGGGDGGTGGWARASDISGAADAAPSGYMPWFEVPGRQTATDTVAFGHWSTLGWLGRSDVLSMDTGCVWGGCLSALRVQPQAQGWESELIQVQCEQSQKPGE